MKGTPQNRSQRRAARCPATQDMLVPWNFPETPLRYDMHRSWLSRKIGPRASVASWKAIYRRPHVRAHARARARAQRTCTFAGMRMLSHTRHSVGACSRKAAQAPHFCCFPSSRAASRRLRPRLRRRLRRCPARSVDVDVSLPSRTARPEICHQPLLASTSASTALPVLAQFA